MSKKKKITLISLILIVAFLITGFAISTSHSSRKSSNTEKAATTEAKKLSEVKESDVASLLPELDDSYVVTGSNASVIAPTSDQEGVNKITADTSKVDFSTEGTYPVTYTVQLKKSAVKKALKENAASSKAADTSEKKSSKKTTSDKKSSNSNKKSASDQSAAKTADNTIKVEDDVKNDYIEVKVDKTIEVVSPEKAAELTAQGSSVLGYNPDENAAVAENTENPDSAATLEDAAVQEAGQNNNGTTASNAAASDNGSNSNKNSNTANAGNSNKGTGTKKNPASAGNNTSANAGNSNKAASSSGSSQPAPCQHNWVARTHTVHHDAIPEQGHYETVQKETGRKQVTICHCGKVFNTSEEYYQHFKEQALANPTASSAGHSYTVEWVPEYSNVQTWVVDTPGKAAYDETVTDGYYCTKCGATK